MFQHPHDAQRRTRHEGGFAQQQLSEAEWMKPINILRRVDGAKNRRGREGECVLGFLWSAYELNPGLAGQIVIRPAPGVERRLPGTPFAARPAPRPRAAP